MEIIRLSLYGGVMIAVILLLRALLQHRVHRGVWLYLWALAALRLMIPVTVPSKLSIYNVFRAAPAAVPAAPAAVPSAAAAIPASAAPAAGGPGVLTIAWLCVAAGLMIYFAVMHLRGRRRYRCAVPVEGEPLPKGVRLRRMEGLPSPLTYGFFRPVILIPAESELEGDEFRHVLAHELSHARHRDVLHKALLLLTASVHWFNPLVWVMAYTAMQDMEMRCDAEAVQSLGDGSRRAYACTLVAAEERKFYGYMQLGFSYSSTGQRIKALAKGKPGRLISTLTGIAAAVVLLLVFATGGKAAPAPEVSEAPAQPSVSVAAPEPEPAPKEEPMPAEPVVISAPEAPEVEETAAEAPEEIPAQAPAEEPEEVTAQAPAEKPEEVPEEVPEEAPAEEPAPEEAPAQEPEPEPRAPERVPQTAYVQGSVQMAYGEERPVTVGNFWTELYSDNPSVLQVSGVFDMGGTYGCVFYAQRDGVADVYYNLDGSWQYFATVTVLP